GVDTGRVLRSTDDGVSWSSVVAPTGLQSFTGNFGVNNIFNSASITSPASSVWLVIDNDGRIFRSTDDGATFAQTQQIGAASNTTTGVMCVSSTVCAAYIGTSVFRSTDVGVSWTQVATLGVAPRILVNLGNNVIIGASALVSTVTFFRSSDGAVTWEQLPAVTPATACTTGNWTSSSISRNGAAVLGWDCVTPGAGAGRHVLYSPIIGAGERGIIGENGTRWDINSSGAGGVYQGSGALNSSLEPWHMTPVQRATLLNTQTTGAADTAVVVTLAAIANARAHLYRLDARCSAGTAQLTVQDGAATIWTTPAATVGTAQFATTWGPGLTGTTNTALTITLSTCGVGNTGTLIVQADRF
ncbi:MAG: WD40/YVTN/BNR-like repeat-containing protein, partial [Nitrospiraceae bacterium]